MPADDDLDRAGGALAQDRVHIVQGHAVHHCVIDLHDLIPTPRGDGVRKGWMGRGGEDGGRGGGGVAGVTVIIMVVVMDEDIGDDGGSVN